VYYIVKKQLQWEENRRNHCCISHCRYKNTLYCLCILCKRIQLLDLSP